MDKKAVQIIKSINNTDLGNDDKPNAKAYNDIPDKDPREEALEILIKSLMLVYLHIPLYKPK